MVVGRGLLPADVLLIGEAPGKSEDVTGLPFIGRAGDILNEGIKLALTLAEIDPSEAPRVFITNVVFCRPTDEAGGPNRQPTAAEAAACFPNLQRVYNRAMPKVVVLLGKVPVRYVGRAFDCQTARLDHPAYIARRGGLEAPEFLAFARNLGQIFKGVKDGGE
jgi:DNA polymerase